MMAAPIAVSDSFTVLSDASEYETMANPLMVTLIAMLRPRLFSIDFGRSTDAKMPGIMMAPARKTVMEAALRKMRPKYLPPVTIAWIAEGTHSLSSTQHKLSASRRLRKVVLADR